MARLAWLCVVVGLAAGCGPEESAFVDGEIGVLRDGLTVGGAGGCSTAIVAGLSKQLIDEQNCIRPNALDGFASLAGVSIASGVNAYLEPQAVTGLEGAISAHGGTIGINSALRTVAQQYLLYKWQGSCGIQIAAVPGSSNHETGIAIDVSDYSSWRSALENHGWRWFGSGDVVHFDYIGSGSVDLRADSVLAFQRLWNLNNPGDKIAEDGSYGPATEARLAKTDANGFAKGSTCAPNPPPPPPPPAPTSGTAFDAKLVQSGGPATLAPGETGTFWVEYQNTGTSAWTPGKTNLGTTSPHDRMSALVSETWLSSNRPATVGHATAPGEIGRFTFTVTAPADAQAFDEHFALVEEGVTWFGPDGDHAYALSLAVLPPPDPADPKADAAPGGGGVGSGCDVAGPRGAAPSGGALLLLLWALALRGRMAAHGKPVSTRRSGAHLGARR
jgi:hypothetical protein